MKLLRVGPAGRERPAILDAAATIRDLSQVLTDINGSSIGPESLNRIRSLDLTRLPILPDQRIGPCVAGVGKFILISLNYVDHAAEAKQDLPREPVVLLKATSAISGPNDPVLMPRGSTKLDWEVELGFVIGTRAKYVGVAEALEHVAGYCVVNDVSERVFQLERGGSWDKGKSCDSFGPIGPWLVTRDEVPDPKNLRLWLEVDGRRYQDGSTATMLFGIAEIVSYLSQFMTLHPGDVVATGTPPGVGMAQVPPVFLRPGNVMRLGIEGLGEQRQMVVAD